MLTGCQRLIVSSPTIPPNLKQECPELRKIESRQGKDLVLWVVEFVGKYNDCRAKHKALVDSLE